MNTAVNQGETEFCASWQLAKVPRKKAVAVTAFVIMVKMTRELLVENNFGLG